MFERFTANARRTVLTAVRIATERRADKTSPEHLLLAVVAEDGGGSRLLAGYGVTAAHLSAALDNATQRAGLTDEEISALRSVGIDADEVFRRVEEAFGPDAFDEPTPAPPRRRRGLLGGPFDPQARKVMELSLREAIALGHRSIGTEHILLGLLRQGISGPMSTVLTANGVSYDDAKRRALAQPPRPA
jgi:ATP-dependent Clp protease ATP-binding subunit ClpA